MFEMRFPDWARPWANIALGEPFERKQQHATSTKGRKPGAKNCPIHGTRRGKGLKTCQKTNLEFLLKEPFGNSIPESKLRGRS